MCDWKHINNEERVKIYTNMDKYSQVKNIKISRHLFLSNENKSDRPDVLYVINIGHHLLGPYVPTVPSYWKKQNDWRILEKYKNQNALLTWGDNIYRLTDTPCLSKVRFLNKPNGRVLMRFNNNRHWDNVNKAKKCRNKLSFAEKRSTMFWRGAPTGCDEKNGPFLRMKLVSQYYNNTNCDIGFTPFSRGIPLEGIPGDMCKDVQDILGIIKYKYIISVDGNDKDSGLNWKLASDSLVFMNHPKIESWLMESKLEPWVHYVPLAEDFSDLIEKFQWAEKNPDKCVEIIKNANLFMDSNFGDEERERKIEQMVITCYLENVDIQPE